MLSVLRNVWRTMVHRSFLSNIWVCGYCQAIKRIRELEQEKAVLIGKLKATKNAAAIVETENKKLRSKLMLAVETIESIWADKVPGRKLKAREIAGLYLEQNP